MASKSKKRSKRRSSVDPLEQVRRNLERGNYKQALKDVRVCFRQHPTPEHRNLLEHAYVGRAQQLVQQGLRDDARRILQELLDLGVTEPSVEAGLPDLLLSVGMLDSLPADHDALTDAERDRLTIKAADQAVLRPKDTPAGMPEIRDDALKVRAALEAVEQEDEPTAMTHLRDISRHSPLADWKYFVRGLIAYYGHDKPDMLANWDRLDPGRAAVRIAMPLRVMAGVAPTHKDSRVRAKIGRLEKQVADQAVLGQLMKVRQFAVDHDWPQMFRTLRTARGELRKLDDGVYRRIVSWLCGIFVCDGLVDELERLTRSVDSSPFDPRWNRARALARENSDDYDDYDAEQCWRKYLRDLENASSLSPSERDLARGMIWLHLAGNRVDEAMGLRSCRCRIDHTLDIEEVEEQAMEAFERSLTLAPTYEPAYEGLASFHFLAGRPDAAAQAWRRLLNRVPDNLDALHYLGTYYLSEDEPLKAREFAERARGQKPLDKKVGTLLWATHVGAARHYACEGQCEKARQELAIADQLQPARQNDYDVLARKATLETKAGCIDAARQSVERAQEHLFEPTALWLVMTIEAIRYDLPKEEAWLYEKRWQDALKRRCRSETAGLMCRMMHAHLKTQRPYPQRSEHVEQLLKYVRRCSRVKWQAEDLRSVCEFLNLEDEEELLAKFAKKGIRQCPEVALFHMLVGTAEIGKGPMRCNLRLAMEHLQEAIRLGSASNDPRDEEVARDARRGVTLLEEYLSDDDEYDDDDDDEYDEYEDEPHDGDTIGISPGEIMDRIRDMCGRMGLDPDEVLEDPVLNDLVNGRSKKS